MTLRKKTATTAVLIVTSALVLTACSGSGGSGGSTSETTITFGMWDEAQRPIYEAMFDDFTEKNPDITVEIQLTPWDNYWTKLQTAASGGSTPDIFWMNGANFPLYASSGVISPIQDQVEGSGFDLSPLPEGLQDLYTWEGELYTLPNNYDTVGVWYNSDLFDAAGLAYPQNGWTWEDYQRTAEALTDPAAGVWGTAAQLSEHTAFYNTIYQAGGYVLSEDGTENGYNQPEAQQGLQYWVDMLAEGSSPSLAQMADTDVGDLFMSGKIAMLYNGSWNALTFSQSELGQAGAIAVAPLPEGPASNASIIHGLANVVSSKASDPEAAYKLVEFLGSPAAADIYTEGGVGFSGYESSNEALIAKYADSFDLTPFADAAETGIPFPRSKNSQVWMDLQVENLTPVWALEISAEEGASTLYTEMQEALDAER